MINLPAGRLRTTSTSWLARGSFWKPFLVGLAISLGAKSLVNWVIEPIIPSSVPISSMEGQIFPFPPGLFAITHYQHWADGGLGSWFVIGWALVIALLFLSLTNRTIHMGVGLFLAGAISNQGEELLFGHATDFLFVRLIGFGGLTVVLNFADLMLFFGVLLLLGALLHRLLNKKLPMLCTNCDNQVDECERLCKNCIPPVESSSTAPPQRSCLSRKRVLLGVWLVAIPVIVGVILLRSGLGLAQTGSGNEYVTGVGVQHEIMPTRNHVTEGQVLVYNSIPATSGGHWPQWSKCGFFEAALPDERIVHNLEHSNIVVSYNLTTPKEVEQLREVVGSIGLAERTGVARLYNKIPEGTVALAAWGVSDTMTGIDEERIATFFENYAGTLGPEGNIPCVNSGVMP